MITTSAVVITLLRNRNVFFYVFFWNLNGHPAFKCLPVLVLEAGSELIPPVVDVVDSSVSTSIEFSADEVGVVPTLPLCFFLQLFKQLSSISSSSGFMPCSWNLCERLGKLTWLSQQWGFRWVNSDINLTTDLGYLRKCMAFISSYARDSSAG